MEQFPTFELVMLAFGLIFITLGAKLLFQKGFAQRFHQALSRTQSALFSDSNSYHYNKFLVGTKALVFGILFTGFALYSLLEIWGYL